MSRIFVLCMVTGVLTGCAAPAFVPPTGDNTVKLEVRSSLPPGVNMTLFTYENGLTCSNRQLLNGGSPTASSSASQVRQQTFDTRLKTDSVQTLDGFFSQGSFYCRIAVSFYPQKDRIYTARPVYGAGRCSLLVFDTTATVGGVVEKTLTKRVAGEPLLNGGGWCTPIAANVIRDKLQSTSSSSDIVEESSGGTRPDKKDGIGTTTLDDLQNLLPSKN